jgi:hypothetical protein
MVHEEPKEKGSPRKMLSHYLRFGTRFNDVGEPLVMTCVFNCLKYYASNPKVFQDRLLRYARTIECAPDAHLVFEHLWVRKTKDGFALVPRAEYAVDPVAGTIEETVLAADDASVQPRHISHEAARPGSYAPLGS